MTFFTSRVMEACVQPGEASTEILDSATQEPAKAEAEMEFSRKYFMNQFWPYLAERPVVAHGVST